MSTLIVQLPERRRLAAGSAAAAVAADEASTRREFAYAASEDGIEIEASGVAPASLLPKRSLAVAVIAEADVAWHRIVLPKAPPSRLREALSGVLEDALLDDAERVHLAVAPLAVAGQPTWIAAVDGAWLRGELAALQRAGVFIDRVVPMAWPDDPPIGHFHVVAAAGGVGESPVLTWAHADGVASLRLAGGLARAVVHEPPPTTRWTTSPRAAVAAEQWLGAPVNVMPDEQRLLQAARSLWDLRQFDLVRKSQGSRQVRDWLRQAMSPAWRPARIGLAGLVVAQLLGLNLWAFAQRTAIEQKKTDVQALVRQTFPRVTPADVQRDAAAVMRREAQAIRTQAGRPGDTDLEPMLLAAAAAWPSERPPVETLRYDNGRLTLGAAGWSDAQIESFRNVLAPAGWSVQATEGRLVVTRPAAGRG
jgi:general secretion pathway protein L